MASAPDPLTVLAEAIGAERRAVKRGADPDAAMDRLHHLAGTIEHRRAVADAIRRNGYTPHTARLVAELRGWQVIAGDEDDGPGRAA